MRALDLFCCAGGAARGLQRAGYHVTGVDIEHHYYAGNTFIQGDVFELIEGGDIVLEDYDFIWASPPCQQFCAYRRRDPAKVGATYPNLIPQTRNALSLSGVPYAIENVPGAPLRHPIVLCGSMFGLEVRRHRWIEASDHYAIASPSCDHASQHGDFPQATNRTNRRRTCEIGVYRIPLATQKRAMGIDWEISLRELSEAVPPAYAEYVAREFLRTR